MVRQASLPWVKRQSFAIAGTVLIACTIMADTSLVRNSDADAAVQAQAEKVRMLKLSGKGNKNAEVVAAVETLLALKAKANVAQAQAPAPLENTGALQVTIVSVDGSALHIPDVDAKSQMCELRRNLVADALETGHLVQVRLILDGRVVADDEQLGNLATSRLLELQMVTQAPDKAFMKAVLEDPDKHMRYRAAVALETACVSTLSRARNLLNDSVLDVRLAAARSYLRSPFTPLRRAAAAVLVQDGPHCNAVALLHDADLDVRRMVIARIGALGYKTACRYTKDLEVLLCDEDEGTRQRAASALKVATS